MMKDVDSPMGNAELRLTLAGIESEVADVKTIVNDTHAQAKLTNGRVTTLERWKYITIGGIGVLTVIVVPILGWALYVLVNIQGQVHTAVNDALSSYNIQNETNTQNK